MTHQTLNVATPGSGTPQASAAKRRHLLNSYIHGGDVSDHKRAGLFNLLHLLIVTPGPQKFLGCQQALLLHWSSQGCAAQLAGTSQSAGSRPPCSGSAAAIQG